jgi:hypothetical protein
MSFHPPRENSHQPETSDGKTALTGFIDPKKNFRAPSSLASN